MTEKINQTISMKPTIFTNNTNDIKELTAKCICIFLPSKLVVHLLSWREETSAKITRFYIHLNDQLIANTQFREIIRSLFLLYNSL